MNWKLFGATNLIFLLDWTAVFTLFPMKDRAELFLIRIPLIEAVILLGISIWRFIRRDKQRGLSIVLGIFVQGVVWCILITLIGLLSLVGGNHSIY